MKKQTISILAVISLFLALCTTSSGEKEEWHFEGFKRRVTYSTSLLNSQVASALQNSKIFARMDVNTHGLLNENRSDFRVCDENGNNIEFYVGPEFSPGISRVYCRGGSYKKVHVYFGNDDTELPDWGHNFQPDKELLYGVSVKTYFQKTENTSDPEKVLSELSEKTPNNTLRSTSLRLDDSKNGGVLPHFWHDSDMVVVAEGYIFTPWEDFYEFGTNSHGAIYILIDGVQVCGLQYRHYRDDSFNLGEKVYLKRGTHKITMVNIRNKSKWRRDFYAEAGWKIPGSIFEVSIPRTALKRFALLLPCETMLESGERIPDFEIIPRYNLLLNNSIALAHLEFEAYGKGVDEDVTWDINTDSKNLPAKTILPFTRIGKRTDVFLAIGEKWTVNLNLTNGNETSSELLTTETKMKLPFFIQARFGGIPPVVFRDCTFGGVMLTVPNDTSFSPLVDIHVSFKQERAVVASQMLRRKLMCGEWLNMELIVDPSYEDLFAVPGAFLEKKRKEKLDLSKGEIEFTVNVNGYHNSSREISFLPAERELPDDFHVDSEGYACSKNQRIIVMADPTNGHLIRRFSPITSPVRAMKGSKRSLIVGDGPDAGNFIRSLALKDRIDIALPSMCEPSYTFSSLISAFKKLEATSYDRVVIAVGTGDAFERMDIDRVKATVHAIYDRAFARGVREFSILLPPIPPGYKALFDATREGLRETGEEIRATMVDLDNYITREFYVSDNGLLLKYPSSERIKSLGKMIKEAAGI